MLLLTISWTEGSFPSSMENAIWRFSFFKILGLHDDDLVVVPYGLPETIVSNPVVTPLEFPTVIILFVDGM